MNNYENSLSQETCLLLRNEDSASVGVDECGAHDIITQDIELLDVVSASIIRVCSTVEIGDTSLFDGTRDGFTCHLHRRHEH